jgi:hypothetical protein
MEAHLEAITHLDHLRCVFILNKVKYQNVQVAANYLYDRNEDGVLLLHEFCISS